MKNQQEKPCFQQKIKENPEETSKSNEINSQTTSIKKLQKTEVKEEYQTKSPIKKAKDLRILFRFNCGKCHSNYSKITIAKHFKKACRICSNDCHLVVLRCTSKVLYGGYSCDGCNDKFLSVFDFNLIYDFIPYCNECKVYTRVYHILLNKSKISVKNLIVYECVDCGFICNKAYYSVNKLLKKRTIPPNCCGRSMKYMKYEREFNFIKLDVNGNSPSYYESLKYNNTFDYLMKRIC